MTPSERETYRLHGRLRGTQRRIAAARAIVADALSAVEGEWAVSVSGGKDSTALTHLALSAGWRGRLFHWRFEETPPENTALVLLLAERFGLDVIQAEVEGDFATYARVGYFFAIAETEGERRAVAEGERRYKRQVEEATHAAGLDGLFWGMRAEESRQRSITISRYGTLYRAASRRSWTCHPLARWSGRDVWAYHVAHDLPWLPVYDAAEDRERERSETTWLGFAELWRRGQGQRLRARDPALWQRLCERWPGLERYG